jgi:hypothetical protein
MEWISRKPSGATLSFLVQSFGPAERSHDPCRCWVATSSSCDAHAPRGTGSVQVCRYSRLCKHQRLRQQVFHLPFLYQKNRILHVFSLLLLLQQCCGRLNLVKKKKNSSSPLWVIHSGEDKETQFYRTQCCRKESWDYFKPPPEMILSRQWQMEQPRVRVSLSPMGWPAGWGDVAHCHRLVALFTVSK